MVRVTLLLFAWFFVHFDKLVRRPPGPPLVGVGGGEIGPFFFGSQILQHNIDILRPDIAILRPDIPKEKCPISRPKYVLFLHFWTLFRSERPISTIFPPYIMSNRTYEIIIFF